VVDIAVQTPFLGVSLVHVGTLFNAYEGYEQDYDCAVSNSGICYDLNTQPPSVSDNSESYVLCCLGYPIRGLGQHCLRYNYSTPYNAFYMQSSTFIGKIFINATNGMNSSTLELTQKNTIMQTTGLMVWNQTIIEAHL